MTAVLFPVCTLPGCPRLSAQARRGAARGPGWPALALAVVLSVGAHLSAMAALAPRPAPVQIAGGASGAVAALGNSFADLTQGAQPSAPRQASPAPAEAAPPSPVTPAHVATASQPAPQTPTVPPVTPADMPPSPLSPSTAPATLAATTAPATTATTLPTLAALAAPVTAPVTSPVTSPVRPTPVPPVATTTTTTPQMARPVDPPEPVAPAEPAEPMATADTPRPRARPSPPPEPATRPPAVAAAAVPAGNAEQDARRGTATGQQGSAATPETTPRTGSAPGNAAASNYPGQVMARIQRTRQQRVGGRGVAVVGFTIGTGGEITGTQIQRSSGSGAIDAAALDHVRRAAPFPAPPAGAQRSFSFEFVVR